MPKLTIRPYRAADSAAACALEHACVQGSALALRFRRPTFHARSQVYEDALILCGWHEGRLVGTVAAARKRVRLQGDPIRATYFYDLRVHPDFRGQGLSHQLIEAIIDRQAADADCLYFLIAGQNARMLGIMREHYHFGSEVVFPLTYVCLPVFQDRPAPPYHLVAPADVRARHLDTVRPTFVPPYQPERFAGHVTSLQVDGAGCSLWTNEHLLAEEVVRLPLPLRLLRALRRPLAPLIALPHVPSPGEAIRSLFLYDVYADSEDALGRLLDATSTVARRQGYTVLYLLMRPDDPLLAWTRAHRWVRYQFPYRLLARGRLVPHPDDRVYLDVRDV